MSRKFKMMDQKLRESEIERYMKLTKHDLAIMLTDTTYLLNVACSSFLVATDVMKVGRPVSKTKPQSHGNKKTKTRRLFRSSNCK